MDGCQNGNSDEIKRLLEASRAGDRSAFDQLVRLYQQRAMKVATKLAGDVNEAAEAAQDAFVKAYLNIHKLRDLARFEVWLLRIVTNAALTRLRAKKRRLENVTIPDELPDEKAISPAERQTAEELAEAISAAMSKLTKKEAQAIGLFGIEGLSQKQAAKIMGCSVEAVRWHVFKARQKLKVLLKEYL